jgi:hypothetical protein
MMMNYLEWLKVEYAGECKDQLLQLIGDRALAAGPLRQAEMTAALFSWAKHGDTYQKLLTAIGESWDDYVGGLGSSRFNGSGPSLVNRRRLEALFSGAVSLAGDLDWGDVDLCIVANTPDFARLPEAFAQELSTYYEEISEGILFKTSFGGWLVVADSIDLAYTIGKDIGDITLRFDLYGLEAAFPPVDRMWIPALPAYAGALNAVISGLLGDGVLRVAVIGAALELEVPLVANHLAGRFEAQIKVSVPLERCLSWEDEVLEDKSLELSGRLAFQND